MERSRYRTIAAALCCAFYFCGAAGFCDTGVRLVSGETIEGKLQLNNNQITVTSQSTNTKVELANVLDAVFRDDPGPVKEGMFPPGVVLVNGSVIAGNVTSLDDPVRFGENTVPLASIAWVVFQPLAIDKSNQPQAGQTGGIMPNGDFFPGTVGALKDNRVSISSLLFGPQRFSVRGKVEIAALVLRDIRAAAARYEVLTRDGSIYLVNGIGNDRDNILLTDPLIGSVKIHNDRLLEIRLARNHYTYLTGLKPDRVETPKGVDATTAVQVPQPAEGAAPQILQTAVNAAATYTIPQGCTAFSCAVSMAPGAPQGVHFTFSVYADGKSVLFRSKPIAAGDIAQHLNIPLENLHYITLRIEPADRGGDAATGRWIQPMFIQP